ncbi:Hypothetical protein SCLAV_5279 [Streptomyces clavuligerus]|uniref:Uncharacterized protein n=1 Tax=Streptomyces clavuligerus TaxID=1901 RepID=B5GVK4_STRCL|nr:hypothetical protein SSCG_03497 [Streptomyces clavuligerus]EFG10352.1 Hypothetical protein SCLAV_5279 [Streptomyces clavuligerus]
MGAGGAPLGVAQPVRRLAHSTAYGTAWGVRHDGFIRLPGTPSPAARSQADCRWRW